MVSPMRVNFRRSERDLKQRWPYMAPVGVKSQHDIAVLIPVHTTTARSLSWLDFTAGFNNAFQLFLSPPGIACGEVSQRTNL